MSDIYKDLEQGLKEAIKIEKGILKGKSKTYSVEPIKEYTQEEIRSVRMKSKMSQSVFAAYLGVSVKTVEAWERGRTHPTGPAYRLIELLDKGIILPFIKLLD